jgi:polysaccharide pyruvyl transferase CsaB
MNQIQVVLCGYYGYGNGGDEALLASMLEMLPEQVRPIVLSGNPQLTQHTYGVPSYDRMNPSAVMTALRQSQALILGGGSLIQDATSLRNSVYYGGLMGLAGQLGLKTIAIAQGIGPINSKITQWIAKRAFGACTAVSVRDPASATLLDNWGISSVMAPDPVWSMRATPAPEISNSGRTNIAVTLRSHPQMSADKIEQIIQALITLQTTQDKSIAIVPFQLSTDLEISQQIYHRLDRTKTQLLEIVDPRQLKGVFQNVDLAIGMRYHSLIMAAAEGCKCWAISYDPKVSKLMTEIEMPGWEIEEIPTAAAMAAAWQTHLETGLNLDRNRINGIAQKSRTHKNLLLEALLAK